MDSTLTRSRLVRWYIAICAIFLASGLSISTWASRVACIVISFLSAVSSYLA